MGFRVSKFVKFTDGVPECRNFVIQDDIFYDRRNGFPAFAAGLSAGSVTPPGGAIRPR